MCRENFLSFTRAYASGVTSTTNPRRCRRSEDPPASPKITAACPRAAGPHGGRSANSPDKTLHTRPSTHVTAASRLISIAITKTAKRARRTQRRKKAQHIHLPHLRVFLRSFCTLRDSSASAVEQANSSRENTKDAKSKARLKNLCQRICPLRVFLRSFGLFAALPCIEMPRPAQCAAVIFIRKRTRK